MEALDFSSVKVAEIKVNNLLGKNYILREAKGATVVEFNDMRLKATRMSDGKVVGIDGMANAEPFLVSRCLFEVDAEGKETAISPGVVKSFPGHVMTRLYIEAKKLSKIDEEETEETVMKEMARLQKKIVEIRTAKNEIKEKKELVIDLTDGSE